jgi:hypothetical protein
VVIRYPTTYRQAANVIGTTVTTTADGVYWVYKFTSSGSITF